VTATIGVSVGLGLYTLAVATTFLAFVVLISNKYGGHDEEYHED